MRIFETILLDLQAQKLKDKKSIKSSILAYVSIKIVQM